MPVPRSHKARALVAFLALRPGTDVARERICDLFWPDADPSAARAGLKTATWTVRRSIRAAGYDPDRFLRVDRSTMCWTAATRVDVADFLGCVNAQDTAANERALSLYAGPFLEGNFDEWPVLERERIEGAYEALLVRTLARRDDPRIAATLLERDPYCEDAYVALINCEVRSGRYGAARALVQRAREAMHEIAVEPSARFEECAAACDAGFGIKFKKLAREAEIDALIESLYDSVLDPEQWEETMIRLGGALKSRTAHLYAWDRTLQRPLFSHLGGDRDASSEHLYLSHYAPIDPRRKIAKRAGEIYACHQYFDEHAVAHDETYADFLTPRGYRYFAGGKLMERNGTEILLGINRSKRQGHFDEPALALLRERFLPHISRAAILHHAIVAAQRREELFRNAFDALELPMILLEPSGRIISLNRAAEQLIVHQDGICALRGRLSGVVPDDAKMLARLVRNATVSVNGHDAVRLEGRVQRVPPRPPWRVVAMPLGERGAVKLGHGRPAVALVITAV